MTTAVRCEKHGNAVIQTQHIAAELLVWAQLLSHLMRTVSVKRTQALLVKGARAGNACLHANQISLEFGVKHARIWA